MTLEEAAEQIRRMKVGEIPMKTVDIPHPDGGATETIYFWYDGSVTWLLPDEIDQ